jgi:hypothetical protein
VTAIDLTEHHLVLCLLDHDVACPRSLGVGVLSAAGPIDLGAASRQAVGNPARSSALGVTPETFRENAGALRGCGARGGRATSRIPSGDDPRIQRRGRYRPIGSFGRPERGALGAHHDQAP